MRFALYNACEKASRGSSRVKCQVAGIAGCRGGSPEGVTVVSPVPSLNSPLHARSNPGLRFSLLATQVFPDSLSRESGAY